MKTLYFDCFAGASGNMILAGLIGLGVDPDELRKRLRTLDVPDFAIDITNVDRAGIASIHVDVNVPSEHAHRHLHHITGIIANSGVSESVKHRATAIFTRLAEAEARIHGIGVEKVHFHEVGAMDAIIDVVGSCIGFEMLGIERFACSKVHVGSGFAKMEHGTFPVPPPAVAELLKGLPVYSTDIEGELITPTGAAIISTVCEDHGSIPEMEVEQIAYGAGTREYSGFPNVLRLMLGTAASAAAENRRETLSLIETNIDDLSPEVLGYVMERAFDLGALDCWFTPIQMKKNRPGTMVSVLSEPSRAEGLAELLYRETTTLGVRRTAVHRDCLRREKVTATGEYGEVEVKVARLGADIVNVKAEYDQVREIALRLNKPFREVSRRLTDDIERRK